jgi:hypothetical protein
MSIPSTSITTSTVSETDSLSSILGLDGGHSPSLSRPVPVVVGDDDHHQCPTSSFTWSDFPLVGVDNHNETEYDNDSNILDDNDTNGISIRITPSPSIVSSGCPTTTEKGNNNPSFQWSDFPVLLHHRFQHVCTEHEEPDSTMGSMIIRKRTGTMDDTDDETLTTSTSSSSWQGSDSHSSLPPLSHERSTYADFYMGGFYDL